jgi:hypothetical protein
MSKLKLQVEAIKVVSFAPGGEDDQVMEQTLRCTTDCALTAGINSCWCSEYNTCECA